ncbi:hypothetical protein BCR41DRAFT_372986 [Lobosporangium transversale]|uniref:Uncharacterized protein n=1 Tax=Lobosporangium transversale TaxID=64571 RepID=A0A1Y2GGQ5_9FUNG|nr:hypothetical protein BCR41DRAFT_372986 [Lobosporangium transversale]ORZ09080.1 hypothetical protein BCR41DRAFT_372986 [Lobosporangium transversale]|eukprot:XP_021878707.1 hypothetical protein BCR41DRAFT_372986 [Lobosporangium transversale]
MVLGYPWSLKLSGIGGGLEGGDDGGDDDNNGDAGDVGGVEDSGDVGDAGDAADAGDVGIANLGTTLGIMVGSTLISRVVVILSLRVNVSRIRLNPCRARSEGDLSGGEAPAVTAVTATGTVTMIGDSCGLETAAVVEESS